MLDEFQPITIEEANIAVEILFKKQPPKFMLLQLTEGNTFNILATNIAAECAQSKDRFKIPLTMRRFQATMQDRNYQEEVSSDRVLALIASLDENKDARRITRLRTVDNGRKLVMDIFIIGRNTDTVKLEKYKPFKLQESVTDIEIGQTTYNGANDGELWLEVRDSNPQDKLDAVLSYLTPNSHPIRVAIPSQQLISIALPKENFELVQKIN